MFICIDFLLWVWWWFDISHSFHFFCVTDDKPVVVVTHGDLLSLSDRARVRVHLGKLLGIPPKKQIFDIPGG